MRRIRLLDLLCSTFPGYDRERLMARIVCRDVRVNGEIVADPKQLVPESASVDLAESGYVSRGGGKLEHALRLWDIPVKGRIFLDAGASTGGFTDCLLAFGASRVYAVDVGWNQLDFSLRSDARVTVMEKTNIFAVGRLEPPPGAAVADLSFRSLTGAADHILNVITFPLLIALIKPQFETEHQLSDFHGVVTEREDRHRILLQTLDSLAAESVAAAAVTASPITGRAGNQEYLALLTRPGTPGYPGLTQAGLQAAVERLV